MAGDTAERWVRSDINTRFRVDSGQAHTANLAETVGSATLENLLCRVYHRFSISWTLSVDGDRYRFNFFAALSQTFHSKNELLYGKEKFSNRRR